MSQFGIRSQFGAFAVLGTLLSLWLAASARAETPRVLPAGTHPKDSRLGELKDLDGYFPFTPSRTPQEWAQRAERVRRQILVSLGLWPMPTKEPVNAVVHSKVERNDYTVERVYLESGGGHYVSGSLYRPKDRAGKLPGVLCPHGHWNNGRFHDHGGEGIKRELAIGAEKFDPSGRYPLQARCVQLARMGCVVFHYDMVGYADSQQISQAVAHGYSKQRPHMDTSERWGFFSTQAELRQQSIMGLQTWNSIRALDWLTSLPDVDPERIGVTGASGGGTQTFILAAIDPRPAVAFPAVMVSTAMQGGCTCENACNLRVGTGNIEFAALMAPRPLGMSAANDWTKEIDAKGLPELKQHYAMLGVPDRVMAKSFLHFDHNYNAVSRGVMYEWFDRHLRLRAKTPIEERDFVPLTVAEMTVWDDKHPRPASGEAHEQALLGWFTRDAERQIAAWTPTDSASLDRFRTKAGGAVDVLIGRGLPPEGAVVQEPIGKQDRGEFLQFTALLRNVPQSEELPVVFLLPKTWNEEVVVWIHESGKAGLFAADGGPNDEVKRLLKAGTAVCTADLLYQGEFLADGKPLAARRVKNPREFAGYTLGYNHALFAQRVHDVLSLVSFCRNFSDHKPERISLVGLGAAGPWVVAALAQTGSAVDRAAVDTGGFRFAGLKSIYDVNFLPGGAKYGDLPGMLALAAPTRLWLAGEGSQLPDIVAACYRAAEATDRASSFDGPREKTTSAAVDWLLK